MRYDGSDLLLEHPLIKHWAKQAKLISICPEVAGGMSTPRSPAEINKGDGNSVLKQKARVMNIKNQDVTQFFVEGANKALELAQQNNCVAAILTERSPSCGSHQVYDGSFSGKKIKGKGVTSALLEQHGIKVFNQNQLEELADYLSNMT